MKLRLWGRSAAQAQAQAQAVELEAQLITSSREELSQKMDFSLNFTISLNLYLTHLLFSEGIHINTGKKLPNFFKLTLFKWFALKTLYFHHLLFKFKAQKRSSQFRPELQNTSAAQANFDRSAAQRSTILSCAYRSSSFKWGISGRCQSLIIGFII